MKRKEEVIGWEPIQQNDSAVDRRRFLKRAALTATSAPFIATVLTSPAFAQAQGDTCSPTSPVCAPGLICCQTGLEGIQHTCRRPPGAACTVHTDCCGTCMVGNVCGASI